MEIISFNKKNFLGNTKVLTYNDLVQPGAHVWGVIGVINPKNF